MTHLFVIYDPSCGLCSEIKGWLERQPAYVPLYFVPTGSGEADPLMPGLPAGEIAVISNEGDAWVGNSAWIMCLWALRGYRMWAVRLAQPALLPLAQQAFAVLSRHRFGLSRMMGLRSDAELGGMLSQVGLPACPINPR